MLSFEKSKCALDNSKINKQTNKSRLNLIILKYPNFKFSTTFQKMEKIMTTWTTLIITELLPVNLPLILPESAPLELPFPPALHQKLAGNLNPNLSLAPPLFL